MQQSLISTFICISLGFMTAMAYAADPDTNARDIATNTQNIQQNTTNINTNTTNINANTAAINNNSANISANTTSINTNKTDIASNNAAINTETQRSEAAEAQEDGRIDNAMAGISQNTNSIGQLQQEEDNNASLIQSNTDRLDKIDFQVQDIYSQLKRLDGAIAASVATGSMATTQAQTDMVLSVGAGYYNNESALALGLVGNANRYVSLKATLSMSSGDDWSKPIAGASINWAL